MEEQLSWVVLGPTGSSLMGSERGTLLSSPLGLPASLP